MGNMGTGGGIGSTAGNLLGSTNTWTGAQTFQQSSKFGRSSSAASASTKIAPYDNATITGTNLGGTNITSMAILDKSHYRIRQDCNTLTQIKIGIAAKPASASAFYVCVWRKKSNGKYDLIYKSNNIVASLTAPAINTVALGTPLVTYPIKAGDYIGCQIEFNAPTTTSWAAVPSMTNASIYYINSTDVTLTPYNYNWEANSVAAGFHFPIELYTLEAPEMVAIGDSLIEGWATNRSFITNTAGDTITDIQFPFCAKLASRWGYKIQNMGIGGETTTQIAARVADIAGSNAKIVLLEGGVNDIAGGVINQATFIANWTTILNAVVGMGAIPIVLKILPWTNGTNVQMQTRDTWNAALAALCAASYPTAIVVDLSSYLGQFRGGGDVGNLWDIIPAYTSDGVHLTEAGNVAAELGIATLVPQNLLNIAISGIGANGNPSAYLHTPYSRREAGGAVMKIPPGEALTTAEEGAVYNVGGTLYFVDSQLRVQRISGNDTLLGKLEAANFNSTADQIIPINAAQYRIRYILVANPSLNMTTAAGGIYTAAAKGGVTIVAAGQVYTALTASNKNVDLTLANTDTLTQQNIYFSLTTAQGAAATADIYVFGDRID